jgi:hypothetical protein
LAPYLINIKKLSYEDALNIINSWLTKCGKLRQSDREIVEFSLEIVKQVRRLNASKNLNEAIRKHFDYIFNIQEHQLGKQLTDDYRSMKVVPAFGCPLDFISNEIDADELLLPKDHKPNDEILSWFKFREDFIYKSVLKRQKAVSQVRSMFDITGKRSSDYMDLLEELLLTHSVSYSFVSSSHLPVYLVIESEYLPKFDATHCTVEYRLRDYVINGHSFLKIELLVEGTHRYRRFNVAICPFKIKCDPDYRTIIRRLIDETFDPKTKRYGYKETQILLMENDVYKIFRDDNLSLEQINAKVISSSGFLCVLQTRLSGTASLFFRLQSELEEVNESYKMAYCPYCSSNR